MAEMRLKSNLSKAVEIEHAPSNDVAADIFTKGFTGKVKWVRAVRAIGIVPARKTGRKH